MKISNNYNLNFKARIKITKPSKEALIKAGLLSTGVGLSAVGNSASVGFYMDQSVHKNPILFSKYLPENYLDFAKESCLQKCAFEILYNPLGIGNETAALPGSICSTIGNIGTTSVLKKNLKS